MAAVPAGRYKVLWGLGAGAGAALAMIIVMAALRFLFNFPTIPELMLNSILLLLGGESFSAALDQLYYAGRPLMFTIILEGTLLLGGLLGLLYAWLARPNRETGRRLSIFNNAAGGILFGLLIGFLLNTVFLPLIDQPIFADRAFGIYAPSPVPLWAGLMMLALVFGITLQGLLPRIAAVPALAPAIPGEATAAAPIAVSASSDRRQFLRIAGGTVLALVGGAAFTFGGTLLNQGNIRPVNSAGSQGAQQEPTPGTSAQVDPTAPPDPTNTARPLPTDTAEPPTAEPQPTAVAQAEATPEPPTAEPPTPEPPTPAPTNTAAPTAVPVIQVQELTPNDSFYHVSKNFFDPTPASNNWLLEIKGLVDKPYTLTYEQLTALPAIDVTVGMMCISNPIGGGLIGSTTWRGVRMADLIKKAAPRNGVVDVVMRAVDDYSDSIAYKKAMDPNVMVVWEMGGETLTYQHGYPARVLVPGIYGMKHLKWLTSIELVNEDYKGYWQQPSQGWSDPAPVNTMSRIDFPVTGTLDMKRQSISGVAFAGDRSISKVEVSTDGGQTWNEAYIKPPKSGTSWVVWGYDWTPPEGGTYKVQVRATDGNGEVQVAKKADPYPNGATGYHTISYKVRPGSSTNPTKEERAAADRATWKKRAYRGTQYKSQYTK